MGILTHILLLSVKSGSGREGMQQRSLELTNPKQKGMCRGNGYRNQGK